MKKAVISSGSKQYLVSEGDQIEIENLASKGEKVDFDILLLIEESKTTVGKPNIEGMKVTAEVIADNVKADKVTSIRYKAKKRVHKIHGHRQRHTSIKILSIK
jgi:ribosomal protein L21